MSTKQQDFEAYQERKLKAWKDKKVTYNDQGQVQADARTAEQKAFDEYVKSATSGHAFFKRTKGKEMRSLSDFKSYDSSQFELLVNVANCRYNTKGNIGDVIFYETVTSDGIPILFSGLISKQYSSDKSPYMKNWVMIADEKGGGGGTVNITASATATTLRPDQQATAQVNKVENELQFSFGIPQGRTGASGGGGTGGGGVMPIEINQTYHTNGAGASLKQGHFAVNLLDYRILSQQNKFGVSEYIKKDAHGKVKDKGIKFYNYGKKKLPTFSAQDTKWKEYAGMYSGVKKNHELCFAVDWHKTTGTNHDGYIEFVVNKPTGTAQKIDFQYDISNIDNVVKSQNLIDNYGYYALALGGRTTPDHYEVDFKAYYTDEKQHKNPPKRTDTQFEFATYNGHELRSNGALLKDEYKQGNMYNFIERHVGMLNLKDVNTFRLGQLSPDSGNDDVLLIPVPSDCKVPESEESPQNKEYGALILTNNLCEITEDDITSDKPETQPYFIKSFFEDGAGKFYFQIAVGRDSAKKWEDLLHKTQIIYPLKKMTIENLQEGGYRVVMNDGRVINSYDYTQVSSVNDNAYKFHASSNGHGDVTIQRSQIAYLEGNI